MNQSTVFVLKKHLKALRKLLITFVFFSFFNEFNDSEKKIVNFSNPEYCNIDCKINLLSLFKKFELSFSYINYSNFKIIERSFPFCKKIDFAFKLSDEYEIITNPILYQNGVQSLKFCGYKNTISLSSKFISNIKEIKPKSVYLQNKFLYEGKLNFIGILSELPTKMKITFGEFYLSEPMSLWFSNTVLKIFQKDRDDFALFEWKSFKIWTDTKYLEYIKGEHHCTDPYSDWLALCLNKYNSIEFEEFSLISNKEQAAEIDHSFPQCIPNSKSKWTVFILAKDLIGAKLHSWIISSKANSRAIQWLISRWSKLKSTIFTISLPSDSEYITNINKLPPQNIELVVFIDPDKLQL